MQDAQAAIDAASTYKQKALSYGLDVSNCDALLSKASQAFAEGKYGDALTYATQAQNECFRVLAAYVPPLSTPIPGANPTATLVAAATGLFTAGNGFWYGLVFLALLGIGVFLYGNRRNYNKWN